MNKEQFIEEYSQTLQEGNAAFFVGAGISYPSGLPNWPELLAPFAKSLGISDLTNKDLPLIAQYIIDEDGGNRGPFLNSMTKIIGKNYAPNTYHKLISKTNIKTIWTTNYDNLLEMAFASHIVDLKTNDDSISRNFPGAQVEIIKMHGCIFTSERDDIVITQTDYEDFFIEKPAIAHRLKLDLLQKSFLFIGYGYNDPNIKNIITEARRLSKNSTRQHYLVIKKENSNEFTLWIRSLKKYGISVIEIEHFCELEQTLEQLSLKSRGRSVFITGSHNGNKNTDSQQLGSSIADINDIILIDGQSSGIMRCATTAFMEKCINERKDINKHLKFFPNPYSANPDFCDDSSLIPTLKQWRIPLFIQTQIVIAFDGNMGTKAEIEIANDLGCIIIPYFKNTQSVLLPFLFDTEIVRKIESHDTEYLIKARAFTLEISDVINLVTVILRKI